MEKGPDPRLIESMAYRYRHDFGLLDQKEQDAIKTTMRQLWEEVVGIGFYKNPITEEKIRLAANQEISYGGGSEGWIKNAFVKGALWYREKIKSYDNKL